jgi:transcriptional antiterminator
MVEKLRVKAIYDDFIKNVTLTEEQKKILDMLINKETIVKIAMEIGASQRTISYEIKKLKKLYNDYYNLQLTRALLLLS